MSKSFNWLARPDPRKRVILATPHDFVLICQNGMILSTENSRQVMRDRFEVEFKGQQ